MEKCSRLAVLILLITTTLDFSTLPWWFGASGIEFVSGAMQEVQPLFGRFVCEMEGEKGFLGQD